MSEPILRPIDILSIKRVDPQAKDIVDSSGHVAVYKFDAEKNEWTTGVQGAVFIYSRYAEPYYCVFVNYRSNTKVFVDPIMAQTKLKIDSLFMFTKNEQSRTRCYRFNTQDECNRIANLVKEIQSRTQLQSQSQSRPQPMNKNAGHAGILAMLAKAEENLDNSNIGIHANAAQPFENLNKTPGNTSMSVMKFFANLKPAEQKMMSTEPVHVIQIQKHQPNSSDIFLSPLANPDITMKTLRDTTNHNQCETKQDMRKSTDKNIGPIGHTKPTPRKPKLMSPTMFSATTQENKIPVTSNSTTKEPSNVVQIKQSEGLSKPEPLTHSQLLQAMSYLLKSDKDLVKKLHEAYLQSFNEMLTSAIGSST